MSETIRRWVYGLLISGFGDFFPAGWHFWPLRQWWPIEQPARYPPVDVEPGSPLPCVHVLGGRVRFDGMCEGKSMSGNGYIELTGYAGNLPLP